MARKIALLKAGYLFLVVLVALPASLRVLLGRAAPSRGILVLVGRRPVRRLPAFAAFTAYFRHVLAVAADSLAAFLSGPACFLRVEFMGGAFLVGCLATLAGDFALLF